MRAGNLIIRVVKLAFVLRVFDLDFDSQDKVQGQDPKLKTCPLWVV